MVKNIKELKSKYNYIADVDVVYGNREGYYFTVTKLERKNMICLVFSVNLNDAVLEEISNLRKIYPAIPMGGVYKEGTELNVEMNVLNLNSSQEFEAILSAITSSLKTKGLINVCSQSKREEEVGVYRVGTKVKILSQHVFEDQKQNMKKNYNSSAPKSMVLAWMSLIAVFILMVLVKNLIGSVFFLIPMAISAAGLRFGVEAFEKFSGPIHKKDALIIITLFVITLLLAPIINLSVRMIFLGIGPVASVQIAFSSVFLNLETFASAYSDVPFSIAISLYACWGQIQQILGKAQTGPKVSRKNNKLL